MPLSYIAFSLMEGQLYVRSESGIPTPLDLLSLPVAVGTPLTEIKLVLSKLNEW